MCVEEAGTLWRTRELLCRQQQGDKKNAEEGEAKELNIDSKCVSERFWRTTEKALRLRHHVGLHSVLPDWNGWEYVNRLHV